MNILIVYERKNRELENCILLKRHFEKAGYNCTISQFYDGANFNIFNRVRYDCIFVPHLYNSAEVLRTIARFGHCTNIINLQYEQVLSAKWESLGHHTPSGYAQYYDHICWGPSTTNRLRLAGIDESKLHTVGALQLDLLRKEYRLGHKLKKEICTIYDLEFDKPWILFLSSFTYADITPNRLKMNEEVAGTSLSSFVDIHTASRNKILSWFENALESTPEKIFIYRPHPDELELRVVKELEKKYSNFHILSEGSAKLWIEASDQILSWYSTTVVESHFLEKPYSILRPLPLPSDFDSVLLSKGNFVTSQAEFSKTISKGVDFGTFALTDEDVSDYYLVDEVPTFAKILKIVEKSINRNKEPSFGFLELFSHRSKSLLVILLHYFVVRKKGIFNRILLKISYFERWEKEIVSQEYSDSEANDIHSNIVSRENL